MTNEIDPGRFRIVPETQFDGGLELKLRCLVRFLRAVRRELRSELRLPWKQRLRAWRRGFSSNTWTMCDLSGKDTSLYLPDISSALGSYRINGFANPIIGDKLVLSRILAAFGLPHPAVVSTIVKGRLHLEDAPFDPDLPRALEHSLDRFPRQVFRPTWSGAGQGVFFLDRADDGLRLNGVPAAPTEVHALLSSLDRYLATAYEEQAAYARAIYPGSPNTLRILSLWDLDRGEPFIAAASHRFGASRSAPIDNWHQGRGGFCAAIDLDTSRLGKAATLSPDKQVTWTSSHPETGAPIEGVTVPGLAPCIEGLLRASGRLPFCPCIGWDVLLTDEGFRIIEANTVPGHVVWQVHTPLLKDPRSRAFYRHWGLVRDGKAASAAARRRT